MALLPKVKLAVVPVFPAQVDVTSPITLVQDGLTYVVGLDLNAIRAMFDAIYQPIDAFTDQEITSGASANVDEIARTVRVNKTVGSATALTLPLAIAKTCDVTIVDWKGDAGTNNITITPSGSEKINGLSSWIIAGDNGSVTLKRIAGVGYST